MGNSYKNCKIQDNTAELIYENGSLFVTIFENNIVHVAQKPGIESVAIEEGFIPKTATPDITCKDTSDVKGTAAEAGVSDAAVKAVISARDITVNVKDNEKLDIYYKGKLVLSDYETARKRVRRIRTRILPSQSLRDILSEKMKKKLTLLPSSKSLERMMLFTVWEISRDASTSVDIHM